MYRNNYKKTTNPGYILFDTLYIVRMYMMKYLPKITWLVGMWVHLEQ